MAYIVKSLGSNTIVTSGTTNLYTVPAGKSAMVSNVRLTNGNTGPTPALNLQVKPSGSATARRIYDKDFTISALLNWNMEDAVTLGQGDILQLDVGSGTQNVAYVVSGIERE